VGGRHFGPLLSLLRQGFSLEAEFGTHSLEAMLGVAETVEASVYEPGSLRVTPTGLLFSLANPPLRLGAFSSLRLRLDGAPVDPALVRVRTWSDRRWRETRALDATHPLLLGPGERSQVAVDILPAPQGSDVTVRLELTSVAIPPVVWLEFRDRPTEGASG
jgi:hypothetical protein